MAGAIFNIQRFSVDDGPGIRTLVFFKGCPLQCEWCSNPESQSMKPQVMYYPNKCKGCGICIEKCEAGCINADNLFGIITDHDCCIGCGACVDACYYGARELMGENVTVDELMNIIKKDYQFYENSNGGVTFSGGEPMMQAEFLREVLKECKEAGIHTAVETCGFSSWMNFKMNLEYIDLVFCDYKHCNDEKHQCYANKGNKLIKENIKKLSNEFNNLIVRIPYIPGFNSDDETLKQMIDNLVEMNVKKVEILPYHRIGSDKYKGLGRVFKYEDIKSLKVNEISYILDLFKDKKIEIKIGGKNNQKMEV